MDHCLTIDIVVLIPIFVVKLSCYLSLVMAGPALAYGKAFYPERSWAHIYHLKPVALCHITRVST